MSCGCYPLPQAFGPRLHSCCFNGVMDTLTSEECQSLLEEEKVAHIGVITDGGPYVTPISYVLVGGHLAFRTAPGRRTEAIEADPRVSIEVSRYDEETGDWSSVIVTGTARVMPEGEDSDQVVVDALFDKYRHAYQSLLSVPSGIGLGPRFIVTVEIAEISGRTSGGFLTQRTRPGRL